MTSVPLSLRRFTAEDVDLVLALTGDAAVMRHLGRPMTREQVVTDELPRLMANNDRTDGLGHWAASDTGFVGWFSAKPHDPELHEVELGYRIVRSQWGRGYATAGARLMIARARGAGAERVVATTMAVNVASRRVLEKAGLRHVRTWYGEWDDPLPGAEQGDVDYVLDLQPASVG